MGGGERRSSLSPQMALAEMRGGEGSSVSRISLLKRGRTPLQPGRLWQQRPQPWGQRRAGGSIPDLPLAREKRVRRPQASGCRVPGPWTRATAQPPASPALGTVCKLRWLGERAAALQPFVTPWTGFQRSDARGQCPAVCVFPVKQPESRPRETLSVLPHVTESRKTQVRAKKSDLTK